MADNNEDLKEIIAQNEERKKIIADCIDFCAVINLFLADQKKSVPVVALSFLLVAVAITKENEYLSKEHFLQNCEHFWENNIVNATRH